MNARKLKSGQSAKKIKPWRLEAQMEFIKPYLFTENDNEVSNIPALPESPISVSSPLNDSTFVSEESCEEIEKNDELNTHHKETSGKKLLVTKKKTDTAADMLRQYIDMKKSSNINPKIDQLGKYFQSIESTVRSLPSYIQIKLKSQISQLVHNAELEAVSTSTPMPTNIRSSILDLEPTYHSMSFPISYSSTYPTTSHNMSETQNQGNNPSHDLHDKDVYKNFY